MKKNIILNLLCGIAISSVLFSCDDSEPYYCESFTRFATVRESPSKVWLDFDLTQESVVLSNFSKPSDLLTFGVHNGSRVVVSILYYISTNTSAQKYSVEKMDTLKSRNIDTKEFQDTLDHYFYFVNTDLGYKYPQVWTVDQYLNVSFSYFANAEDKSLTKFYLCPKDVKGDTLRMRIISENSDTAITEASTLLLSYDFLSLKTIEAENSEVDNNIKNILSTLQGFPDDSIYIEVATSDSLHIYDRKMYNLKEQKFGCWRGIEGSKRVVRMKNLFN